MVTGADVDQLHALLAQLRNKYEPFAPVEASGDPIEQFLFSLLLWETTTAKAQLALRRLLETFVDVNDIRIAMPEEIIESLGPRYPLVDERALRIRAALNDIFRREDHVSLERLRECSKRDARRYLDSIDGAPQFVAARVCLVSLGAHAAPLDGRLHALLSARSVLDANLMVEEAGAQLERRIRAADALDTYLLLQAWSDASPSPRRRRTERVEIKRTTVSDASASPASA